MITDEQALANKIRVQAEGVAAWIANGYRGTLEWATGVGKSRGSILCIEHLRDVVFNIDGHLCKGLLVVPTEEMRDVDWPAEFEKWGCSMDNLKLVCYASLAKEDLSKYDYIIYDECHRLTVHNLQRLYEFKGPALGLTATFPDSQWDKDQERVLLIRELLPPVHTITTDEAVDLGLISDFEVMVLKFHLCNTHKVLPGGTKKKSFLTTEKARYTYLTRVLQMAMMKKIEGMKFGAISKRMQFLYNLPSKLRLAEQCLDRFRAEEPRKRTLVLCGSIDQANQLCGENVFHSESNSLALDRFQNEEIHELAAVKALNEGKNLVNLEQELIIQVDSQERNLVQRIGRTVRKRIGNPEFKARVVILVALSTADDNWYKEAIKGFHSKRIKEYVVRVPDVKKSEKLVQV